MSILIKKMEMPKGCWACPFAVGKHYECLFTKKSYNWGLTTRPSDCLLIEVSTPHGDLVDRNYLISEYDRQHKGPAGGARRIIENAPTIIEAEGSDT